MRVIAGKFRSRTLYAPQGRETRPTHDRVREALFSVLGDVTDFNVVDLCAGTGALGIEALSRGARHAVFVEPAKEALNCLYRNLTELGISEAATVIPTKVETCRSRLAQGGPYDLVFCDPPWVNVPELVRLLKRFDLPTLLTPEGRFVLEHGSKFDSTHVDIAGIQIDEQRRWGDTAVTIFSVLRVAAPTEDEDSSISRESNVS
jgi:16S rRNA (guanine966-N2)-methyltransferase